MVGGEQGLEFRIPDASLFSLLDNIFRNFTVVVKGIVDMTKLYAITQSQHIQQPFIMGRVNAVGGTRNGISYTYCG